MARKQSTPSAPKRKRMKQTDRPGVGVDQDDHFYFIVGYTSGGVPYGLTWDEVADEDNQWLPRGRKESTEVHDGGAVSDDGIPF